MPPVIKFQPPTAAIPEFAKLKKTESLTFQGAPLFYRVDGFNGVFHCGDQEVGTSLYLHLLDWRWDEATRWRGERQYWIDILFVDEDRNVSLLCLKKDAAQRFNAWIKGLNSHPEFDIDPRSVWLRLAMTEREVEFDDMDTNGDTFVSSSKYWVAIPDQWGFVEEQAFHAAKEWHDSYMGKLWIIPGENVSHRK